MPSGKMGYGVGVLKRNHNESVMVLAELIRLVTADRFEQAVLLSVMRFSLQNHAAAQVRLLRKNFRTGIYSLLPF